MVSKKKSWIFDHPRTEEFPALERMLMESLRPDPQSFTIASEYPLVLGPDCRNTSWVVRDETDGKIVAHANILLREFEDAKGKSAFNVCLIGNVATRPEFRGQGIMRSLLEFLEAEALKSACHAVLLWSDLLTFYQSCGYQTLSAEKRFILEADKVVKVKSNRRITVRRQQNVDKCLAQRLLELRLRGFPTVRRSAEEFSKLLMIPACTLHLIESHDEIIGFCIEGKGADMAGVIHEWGAPDVETLLEASAHLMDQRRGDEIMILTPKQIPSSFQQGLERVSKHVEQCPMALAKILVDKPLDHQSGRLGNNAKTSADILGEGFIWGLDSI
jgi:predicted N-acetyltransferase YhbS